MVGFTHRIGYLKSAENMSFFGRNTLSSGWCFFLRRQSWNWRHRCCSRGQIGGRVNEMRLKWSKTKSLEKHMEFIYIIYLFESRKWYRPVYSAKWNKLGNGGNQKGNITSLSLMCIEYRRENTCTFRSISCNREIRSSHKSGSFVTLAVELKTFCHVHFIWVVKDTPEAEAAPKAKGKSKAWTGLAFSVPWRW